MLKTSGCDHFYVTLPSTSSFSVYGIQNPSNYKTSLKRNIVLDPSDWEVGLAEIIYTRSWPTSNDAWFTFYFPPRVEEKPNFPHRRTNVKFKFPSVHYDTPEHLVTSWSDTFPPSVKPHLTMKLDPITKRVTISAASNNFLRMNNKASIILGFGDFLSTILIGKENPVRLIDDLKFEMGSHVIESRFSSSQEAVSLHRGLSTLYVYTDVAEPQLVGDAHVPLLRTIVDKRGDSGETVYKSFTDIHYVNVSRGVFHEVEVHITDDSGMNIPFDGGRVSVKLHFKKKHI